MSNKLIIITADQIDIKIINKLILTLRDWEFGEESHWDNCTILRTTEDIMSKEHETDKPPLQELPTIEFRGKSVQEVETLLLTKHKEGAIDAPLFLILDDEGVEKETIIVAQRAINMSEEADAPLYLDRIDKVRVPWIEADSMWGNLDIGNLGFEEFCVEDEAVDDDGWFKYRGIMGEQYYEKFVGKRDGMLRELARLDLA